MDLTKTGSYRRANPLTRLVLERISPRIELYCDGAYISRCSTCDRDPAASFDPGAGLNFSVTDRGGIWVHCLAKSGCPLSHGSRWESGWRMPAPIGTLLATLGITRQEFGLLGQPVS